MGGVVKSRTIGRFIAAERTRLGLSQDALARRAGYSRGYVGAVECGSFKPTEPFLRAVGKALGIPVGWLIAATVDLGKSNVPEAINRADELTDAQKVALLSVYEAYREAS